MFILYIVFSPSYIMHNKYLKKAAHIFEDLLHTKSEDHTFSYWYQGKLTLWYMYPCLPAQNCNIMFGVVHFPVFLLHDTQNQGLHHVLETVKKFCSSFLHTEGDELPEI